jgi:hypothetical protein
MLSSRTVFHVLRNPTAQSWVVTMEQSVTFRLEYRTKGRAVEAAHELAREQEPSQVKVHNNEGKVEHQISYGLDPKTHG